jgi:hypothetical protein
LLLLLLHQQADTHRCHLLFEAFAALTLVGEPSA